MKHPRTAIRAAVVERLKSIQKNVFDSRIKPLFDQNLPAILVYTRDERILESRYDGDGNMTTRRELELYVEAVAKGSDDLETNLDTLAFEIEQALDGYTIPNRQADILKLKTTESDMAIDGSKTYGAIRLTFAVIYQTKGITYEN